MELGAYKVLYINNCCKPITGAKGGYINKLKKELAGLSY